MMMNALLVDDDYYVVTALEKKIDWKALSIENIFTAYNVSQAREILQHHSVHILICDIEMPQGNGLELLAWIREEQYSIQTIFLTNYADFNYAQKAIELQSFDYFLKPIEFDKLTLIIRKAISKTNEEQNIEKAIREGYLWKKNQNKIVEHFWRKLILCKTFPSDPAAIARFIADHNLSYQISDRFLPILIKVFPYDTSLGKEDKDLFDYALLNVLYELFQSPHYSIETILEYKDYNWIAVLKWNGPSNSNRMEEICSSFIQKANRFLRCDACCNIADVASLPAVHSVIRQLVQMNEEIINNRNQILFLDHCNYHEAAYIPPNLALLEELLNQANPSGFLEETHRYLEGLVNNQSVNTSQLRLFRLDLVQLVYSFLKNKKIQVHKLYSGETNDQLFMQSLNSIEDMEKYLSYLVNTAAKYRGFAEQPRTIVEEIQQYISKHIGDDLTRTSLAEIVFFNPDYLARLFKKETGVSLGNYIIEARISIAKDLLKTTNMSVNSIASKVGYSNYSYFSKLFKQETGCTPYEYRNR
jgi:two-component system response regulator YesN